MNFNIKDRTIILALVGSRGYGTHNPDSDWDYKGICVSPLKTYITNNNNFEQYEGALNTIGYQSIENNHESVIYDIKKYFQLATACNPNILEILFSAPDNIMDITVGGNTLVQNRKMFLSQKVRHSYAGYAYAQLKKIKSHRQWLLLKEKPHQPTREEFGLPSQPLIDHAQLKAAISLVNKQIETWTLHPEKEIPLSVLTKARESIYDMVAWIFGDKNKVDDEIIHAACYKLGFNDNFSEYVVNTKRYNSALDHYNSYLEWADVRNAKRRELEAKYGYDTKHAMHLVRLLRTCEELMLTGELHVTRLDAEELKAIRTGAWTYDKLELYNQDMNSKLDQLYNSEKCVLPYTPDLIKIDNLLYNFIINAK